MIYVAPDLIYNTQCINAQHFTTIQNPVLRKLLS